MEAIRIAQFRVADGRAEQAVEQIKSGLVPRLEGAPGFGRGYWVLDRENGDGFAITIWDSEADRQGFGTAMKAAMEAGGNVVDVSIRDLPLVATARGANA